MSQMELEAVQAVYGDVHLPMSCWSGCPVCQDRERAEPSGEPKFEEVAGTRCVRVSHER